MTSLREPLINDVIINHIHSGLKKLYKESMRLNENDPIIMFQISLGKIKDLSQMNLEEDYDRFVKRVIDEGNDESFIDRVFDLTFRNVTKHFMESDKGYIIDDILGIPQNLLNIPKNNVRLLHLITIESARGIWTKANLYCTKYSDENMLKNYETAKNIIRNSIIKAIKERLNINDIFMYYTRPKISEREDIKTDFYKFITDNKANVPDRLNWKEQEQEQEKIKNIHYDPDEKIDNEEDEEEEPEEPEEEPEEPEEEPEEPEEEPEEPEEEPEEPEEEPEEPEEELEEPEKEAKEPEEEPEEPEEKDEEKSHKKSEKKHDRHKQQATGNYVSKEVDNADKIKITLLDEKVDLTGIINK